MARLFTRRPDVPASASIPTTAAVTHIPGEDDVDPTLLEQQAANPSSRQDFRDSNQGDRFGNRVTNVTGSVVPQADTELIRWARDGRRHIALRLASTHRIVASWWDDHIDQALLAGDLNPEDMHTAAYRYAEKHQLLPAPSAGAKSAALFNRAQTLTFVSPTSPEWAGFVDSLRHLPEGSTIQTQDGYVLTKDGEAFGDGDISLLLEDFTGAAQHLMPPVAIKQAGDSTFIGQHREDGSWSVQEVSPDTAEHAAESITDAPDGNTAEVIQAEDGDAARGQLHDDMKAKGVTPAETTTFVNPSK